MEDIQFVKYVLNKHINFKNNNAKASFVKRLNDNKNEYNYAYQLTNALVSMSKNNNVIQAQEIRGNTKDYDKLVSQNDKLKLENKKLKQENKELTLIQSKYESLKLGNSSLKESIKNKDQMIKNLKADIELLQQKINNIKNSPLDWKSYINKGIGVMYQELSDCESDYDPYSDEEDPVNQLNKGL